MINRRQFSVLAGVAAAGTAVAACAPAATSAPSAPTPAGNTTFRSFAQVDAGVLNIGYAEDGPADGPPVILLHGWPYDIHSYVDVAPLLAAKGYRVIVPYLRGYGTTRFLSDATFRNGQQAGGRAGRHRADGRARRSTRRSSPASTGARGPPTSSRRSGRSGARRWCR